ncbi:hypothetical protein ACFXG4_03660 [Nocardia sp. NPDC059246]|uniref:hypothetical protein n=1 Tax=unclassified Nocardia TaxID=2637762 RepID=UPI0036ABBDCE
MKFRLKFLWFELHIETPEPVQVSATDLVTALWSAISQNPMQPIVLIPEDDTEDG